MKGMTIIVKTVSSWVKVLIVLFGIYIILFGHLTPGGGFAGGVILASSYVLIMLAFGKEFVQKDLPLALDSKLEHKGDNGLQLHAPRAGGLRVPDDPKQGGVRRILQGVLAPF